MTTTSTFRTIMELPEFADTNLLTDCQYYVLTVRFCPAPPTLRSSCPPPSFLSPFPQYFVQPAPESVATLLVSPLSRTRRAGAG